MEVKCNHCGIVFEGIKGTPCPNCGCPYAKMVGFED